MSETIYLNVQLSSAISRPIVRISDVAEVFCENKSVKKQVQSIIITEFKTVKEYKKVFSTCLLIQMITAAVPNCQVQSLGETDFIVYYKPIGRPSKWKDKIKLILVCLISFFGAAFSIMAFNNDVDVSKMFGQIYKQLTGTASNGFTILELTYSIGLVIGILTFFNHFGKYLYT